MIRHCTREDWRGHEKLLPERVRQAGPCGRTYDDMNCSTICPHEELPPPGPRFSTCALTRVAQ